MGTTQKKPSAQKMGITILFVTLMMGFNLTMVQNYATYSYTDLAGVTPTVMSTCMTIVNSLAVVITFISGAIVSGTRSRLGKYRFWILVGPAVCLAGGFLVFFNVGNSMILKAVVITIGYFMANSTMDFIYTARMALIGSAAESSEERNQFMGRSWQGGSLCYIISGVAVVPMVQFLGSGNETLGFLLTQGIFTIIVMTGAIWYIKVTAHVDPDNRDQAAAKTEKVKFSEMIKAVITNPLAVPVVVSDIVRFTGYYILFSTMVYQCNSVIGSMLAMSYVLGASNFMAFVGATFAPAVCAKLGGRKKVVAVFGLLSGLSACAIGIFGKTTWGFTICCGLYFFFMSFIDTVDSMLYMDAGEYWLHKTGKDTRPYLLSMYNVAVKVAMAVSSAVLGVLLNLINYQPGVVLEGAAASTLTWVVGLAPGLCYLAPVVIMLFHKVSDKEMAEIIKSNAEKYGNG